MTEGDRMARCGGSGELVEQVSPPGIDHRDPAFETREVPCPGCPDCRWTVYITLRVWPDREDTSPIEGEIEHALRPLLGRDETMTVQIVAGRPHDTERA